MTDDHLSITIGMYNGKIHLYKFFEEANFYYRTQILSDSYQTIMDISMTNDHSFMAASNIGGETYVYHLTNETYYVLLQIIVVDENTTSQGKVYLTDNH